MIPKVLIAIVVCVFFGSNCVLADFSFSGMQDSRINHADALRRFKRSLTTICLEIRPSSPQEAPYVMCKEGALPTFPNNANAPTLYDGSNEPSNTAISPPNSFAESNPHIAADGKGNDFQAPMQNLYSTKTNGEFQQLPKATYVSNAGNTQPLFYQQQQPFPMPKSHSSKFFIPPSPDHHETVQQYEKLNGYELIKTKESQTPLDSESKTYILPRTSNTYSNPVPYGHQHNNNYNHYDHHHQPESVNTDRRFYSPSSYDHGVPSANAEKTFAPKQVLNAHEAPTPAIPQQSTARPSAPTTTTTYTSYVAPALERSKEAYMKPTATPFDSSTEYHNKGAGYSSGRQLHSTTAQFQSEFQHQLQPRASTIQRQPVSPVSNNQQQPPTVKTGADRYRTAIDREVFDLPNLGFSLDEFDIMTQGSEFSTPIQLRFPADVHLIPQERMIPAEHMDDPIMRTFYASLQDEPSPADVQSTDNTGPWLRAPTADITSSDTSPIQDYLSKSPLSPPPAIDTIPCSPVPASTYTTPPITPAHPSHLYSACQSNPPDTYAPTSDYDSKCRSCKTPEYSFQPIIIALPCYSQRSCADDNSYKPEISATYENLGLAKPITNAYAPPQPFSILGSPDLLPGTQPTPRSSNPTAFSSLGSPWMGFWPHQQTSSHFFSGPQATFDLLGTSNPMAATLFTVPPQQPFDRLFAAPQQIPTNQNLVNHGQNTHQDSIVGSSYAYTQINTTPKTTTPIPQSTKSEDPKTPTSTTEKPNEDNFSESVEKKDGALGNPADESASSEEEVTRSSVEPVVTSTQSIGGETPPASLEDESKKTFSALLNLAQNAAKIHQSDMTTAEKGKEFHYHPAMETQ